MNLETLKDSMPNLHSAAVSEKELFDKSIDFTRPLKDYPKAEFIANFIKSGVKPQHVYTESLNVDGLVVQDAMEKYLDNDSLSSSMLKAALKTPLHFEFAKSEDKEELEKIKGTPACFNLGTFLHQAILEPTKFERVIIEPNYALNSNEGCAKMIEYWETFFTQRGFGYIGEEEVKAADIIDHCQNQVTELLELKLDKIDGKRAYIKVFESCSGVEAVTQENFIKIQILKKHYEVYGGGILKKLLHHSKREISMYHTDSNTGLDLKIRPDAIQFEENIGVNAIISVKSSGIEDLKAFYYQAAKLHYDLSEGMYQEVATKATGRDFNTTIMVMLQTVAPYAIAILVWSAEDIEMGKHKFHFALNNAKEIIEKESVKGYEVFSEEDNLGLIQMFLPSWNQQEYLPVNI
ncbi:PD-(D/E)XK nuclease-like domain-containing protein [Flavobacterium sp. GT3P67]|uniref:PD-(D/E)XK nuclease-like domain-containing protein n=1 Tax=Flavobacterium sp. GT3P67 TaxID=2541722 RepID=UPI00104F04F1|nr:PD-(D/E)XK nuclease-like domain-containing protein [Flavobacterium sp. GT3P67]TDE53789.1 hypothetical protein E0H99_07165 [Flavobacterium sp. GT3P67]